MVEVLHPLREKLANSHHCLAGAKLSEACQQQQFNRNVEDVERWLSDIESSLVSEDYGKVSTWRMFH